MEFVRVPSTEPRFGYQHLPKRGFDLTGPLSALSVHPWEHQPVASYSAGRDIEAKLISEPSTGTKLDIAATDQIRPIATTTAIPTIHARICIPSTSR